MNNKLPYKNMADEVASRGRYGDTTLIHVNPIEVEGLASLVPLTINPDTGYPEAFLPLLAPFLGTALGTAIGTGAGLTGLGLTAAGAGGSALATTAATGSVEEGLMAGLTGFGLGQALQGASGLTGATDAVNQIAKAPVSSADVGKALADQGSSLGEATKALNSVGSNLPFPPKVLPQSVSSLTDVAQQGFQRGASQPLKALGQEGGLKAFGTEALKMKNLVPIASGLGGITVSEDIRRSDANIQRMKDKKEREGKEAIANYIENRPGMTKAPFSSRFVPGMQPQGTAMKNPYANRYALGGKVRRFKGAGDIQIPPGYVIPTPGLPVIPPVEPTPDPTPVMPDISNFSMGYDPSSIDMATGLKKTPEQMRGMVRGRGLTPVPYNYMAGFMPEYQYVSNIQPTSTSIGATGTGTGTGNISIGGSGSMGIPNVTVGGTNVYKGSYDPDLFAGGTPYNEYLLGNVEKGIPDYLSSYMQNTPYYQYQDQVLNDIYGGGGYGTPGFMGTGFYLNNPMPMPTPTPDPVNPLQSQVDSLNKRIEDLLAQIEGKDETIAEELATDQASRFGQITPDPKSDLIVQEGDLAGKLNIDSDIFDYLDISPEDKAGIQEYNYIPGYENYMGTFEGDNLTEQINSYINQETANLGGLNTLVSADDTYIPQNTFDPNLGAVINEIKQEDGSYKEWAVIPNKGYVEVGSFTVDADGNKTYADKKYASGGQILNSLKTLENYAQPLPMSLMAMNNISSGNTYAEGGLAETEEVDQVEALMQNPVIQEKMSEGDRDLLRSASLVILGRIEDDGSIIERFVEMFGSEALDRLKSELLPNMQQQGLIEGEGGGMDDMVDGVIGDQEKVAVSPGEYIVPADVVGDLGDGNNEQGARIMDDFLSRVRQEKHGTDKQPDPINLDNVMPS
ncbi:MAG: hypothetical protein GOVbin2604_48 [Gammaproteobacteria virus GOV_bin_2604]|nr:MAG: hypothetical protein GOVbin2604_48 [Gammaproteobacteria virus GOV_bin_2604]|tara:strand:+ start:3936 stop:6653 length:2718 start_codon:yes stop_codon:yes gene_type:complete